MLEEEDSSDDRDVLNGEPDSVPRQIILGKEADMLLSQTRYNTEYAVNFAVINCLSVAEALRATMHPCSRQYLHRQVKKQKLNPPSASSPQLSSTFEDNMSPLSDNNLVVSSSTDVTPTKRRNTSSHDKKREIVEFKETKRDEKKRIDSAL